MEEIVKVKFNGKEYEISPLRCKHLKQISALVSGGKALTSEGNYKDVEKWMPFMLDSLRVKNPDVTLADLEEMTIQEFSDIWRDIVAISGIKMVPKGEPQPVVASSGQSSTDASAAQPAGTTVN